MSKRAFIVRFMLITGLVFLYLPLLVLIGFSFNAGKSIAVWSGWSLHWYQALLHNDALLAAAGLSLRLGLISGALSALLGTMAAFALDRFGAFRGRMLLTGLVSGPLVMPEILTGLALLLLYVAMGQVIGWPQDRGMMTLCLAHVSFGMCYVVLVVQARLAGMDRVLEEAAQDLGASPVRVFFTITLPLILPGVISGFLLAFTLSMDDLVISSFVSGPGSSTLPMVVFSKVRLGLDPQINALATLLILMVAMGAGSVFFSSLRQRQSGQDHP